MKSTQLGVFFALAMFLGQAPSGRGENWPGFRGPTGLGYTDETQLPVTWGGPDHHHVLWKTALKGQGHASPIVWEDSVFVCTAYWPPTVRERQKVIPEHHLVCYRFTDGKMLWDTLIPPGPWLRTDFRSGPGGGYAAATPTTDGHMVYCAFGSSVIAAVDFQGKIVWRKEIIPHTFDVTLGSSPILYEDTVILLCAMSQPRDSRVIAFHKSTGDVKWQQKLTNTGFGHSTPVVIRVQGKPQLLVLASGASVTDQALQSLNPANGERLWWCRGVGDVASPAFGAGLVYFDSGRGGLGVTVDPTGAGDVSKTHVRWTVPQVPEGLGSPTIVGRHVYRLHSPGILKCWETATGKQVYAQRLEGISTTWASPIADAQGRLFFANAGKSYVIQSGPEFRVLAVNDLGDGSHPSPAVARGRLFLAGMKDLYCIGTPNRK
jgi:outer membrane protein assembly factor BamB